MKSAWITAICGIAAGCNAVKAPLGEHRDIAPVHGGTMRLANYADVRTLDPALNFDVVSGAVIELLFDRLIDYDRNGKIVPQLAERFETSADGKRYTFKLHEGVLFHDGEELTADDVKRSIERALAHDSPCPAASFYQSILGYSAFRDGEKNASGETVYAPHLSGVVVEGRYLLHVDLSVPDATILPVMTLFFVAPVCRDAGPKYSPEWSAHACGTGPFRLDQWQTSRQIDVVRHAGYYRPGQPYLDRIRFYMLMPALTQRFKFEAGELDHIRDFSGTDSLAYRRDPRWHPYAQWEPAKTVLSTFLNTQMKPFDNVEFRRAFAAAIDWDQLVSLRPEELLPAHQMLPPAVPGHDPSFVGQKHDPVAALEHMKNAGYPFDPATGKGGYPETIRYVANAESMPSDTFAPVMAQQLARIGIRLEIRSVSWPTFLAETAQPKRIQLGYGGWIMDFPDPSDFFEPTLSTEAIQGEETRNAAFYSNPDFDRLLKEAHGEIDPTRRASLYRRCEEIIRDDAPWSIGAYQRFYELVQPYVHGYVVDATHVRDVRAVWIDESQRPQAARFRRGRSALALIRPWGAR
ncbi:MAG TPA: ABC transporter substrate-binding protein [Polyangiaceae bacterium]|jgi:ABC-type transport system substrate-binding protein